MILKEERIGNQRLLLGDCLQVMPMLGRPDAMLTDPPYGIGDIMVGSGRFAGLCKKMGGEGCGDGCGVGCGEYCGEGCGVGCAGASNPKNDHGRNEMTDLTKITEQGMIGEDRILAAFWLAGQKRFCQLLAAEIKDKSGLDMQSDQAKLLMARGLLEWSETNKNGARIYNLTRDGEAEVTTMIVTGNLPKPVFRLTAVPPAEKRARR